MPSGRDVKAGGAYVELSLRDKLGKGLKSALTNLKTFALDAAKVAAGVGLAAVAAGAAAAKAFADYGSELNDASARTGIAVEALSAYKHAAEQSSSSLEGFEGGLKKMQKTIAEAAGGSDEAAQAMARIGLSVEQLKGLAPDQQFDAVAAAINQIQDPTERAAAAMKIFGKSGTELLPMMQDLAALKKEAADAGIIVSSDDAKKADSFGDALHLVWEQAKMVVFYVGAGIADALMEYKDSIVGAMKAAIDWVKNSRQSIAGVTSAIGGGVGWIIDRFGELAKKINDTFGGALDALASGDWKLAGELAVGNLKIAWMGLKDWFDQLFDGIGDSFAAAQIEAIATAKKLWVAFKDWGKRTWNQVEDNTVIDRITNQIQQQKAAIAGAKAAGVPPAQLRDAEAKLLELSNQLKDAANQADLGQSEPSDAAKAETGRIEKQRDADMAALGQHRRAAADAKDAALGEEVNALQKQLDDKKLASRINRALDDFFGGVETEASPANPFNLPDPDDAAAVAGEALHATTRGTFSAAAVQGLEGGPGATMADVAKATKDTAKNTKTIADAARKGGSITFAP